MHDGNDDDNEGPVLLDELFDLEDESGAILAKLVYGAVEAVNAALAERYPFEKDGRRIAVTLLMSDRRGTAFVTTHGVGSLGLHSQFLDKRLTEQDMSTSLEDAINSAISRKSH